MNCPAPESAVTSTMAISSGLVNTSFQARSESAAGRMPTGNTAKTHTAASTASAATVKNETRQPKVSPSQADIGMPSTDATDQPRKMKVIARPRSCGAAMKPIAAAACGVNTAAASMVNARTGHSVA